MGIYIYIYIYITGLGLALALPFLSFPFLVPFLAFPFSFPLLSLALPRWPQSPAAKDRRGRRRHRDRSSQVSYRVEVVIYGLGFRVPAAKDGRGRRRIILYVITV